MNYVPVIFHFSPQTQTACPDKNHATWPVPALMLALATCIPVSPGPYPSPSFQVSSNCFGFPPQLSSICPEPLPDQ